VATPILDTLHFSVNSPSRHAVNCTESPVNDLDGRLLWVARHEAGRGSSSVPLAGFGINQIAQPGVAAALRTIAAGPGRVRRREPVHDVGIESADLTASTADDAAELPAGPAMAVDDFHNAVPAVSGNMIDLVERRLAFLNGEHEAPSRHPGYRGLGP